MMSTIRYLSFLYVLSCVSYVTPLPVADFYPFGQATGDARLAKVDDGSSARIRISIPFAFFDKNFDSLFVNTNGAVSFVNEIREYTPDRFPLGQNRRLLAPFWADVDIRIGGDIWYREESTNQSLLKRATYDVRNAFVKQQRFTATWIYIVTWDKVAFYGASGAYINKTNTFQAVLITNGRHSSVIFNYNTIVWTTGTASSGNSSGLGGIPAQCGFNAGDGIRYFTIPGSGSNKLLNLPTTSNVDKPGVWMFRIDNTDIESGGCNTGGSLTLLPNVGSMLGGVNIVLAGPCYKATDKIVSEFGGRARAGCVYVNGIRSICTVPLFNITGRVTIKVSRDGGTTFPFHGIFTYVSVARTIPRVSRFSPYTWVEGVEMMIEWNPKDLEHQLDQETTQDVSVNIARYAMNNGVVGLHSYYTIVQKQKNTGSSQFIVPPTEGDGNKVGDGRFICIVQVMKYPLYVKQNSSRNEWISSDVFIWHHRNQAMASKRCMHWYENEPNPKLITEDTTLLPCPLTFLQAMTDSGRYTPDETCNLENEKGCARYHRRLAKTCIRTIAPSNKGAGQQCCYNSNGNLIVRPPGAGSLDRVHPDKGIPFITHYYRDIVPYLDCCVSSNDGETTCDTYYEKRPSDNGKLYEPPRPAAGFGEPHMVTLDGVEYTFNGYGEFTVLRVQSPGFTLQGRMQPLTSDTGNQIKATVYTAFAMRENGSDTVQINLNGRGMVDVHVNGDMVELDGQGMMNFKNVLIMKYVNTSKYSAMFRSGISVTVQRYPSLLQLILLVPRQYKGNTSGLLGYWDNDKTKEFLLPDGTFVDTNASASRIHYEFGLTWLTTASQSLFSYERGKSHRSYANPSFQPVFVDRGGLSFNNATLEQEARAACGASFQCLYDIRMTGKISIGLASRQALQEFLVIVNQTETKACVPLDSHFLNGFLQRNDSDDEITYTFKCKDKFVLHGPASITCKTGVWSGTEPKCVRTEPTGLPGYAIGLIGGAILIVICIVVICAVVKFMAHKNRMGEETRSTEQPRFSDKGVASFSNEAQT